MIYGFISDVHGKVDRLLAVFEALKSRGLDRKQLICLGDIVSESDHEESNTCISILRDFTAYCVRGNHDDYALLTRPSHLSKPSLEYLASLPEMLKIGNLTIIHDNPLMETREGVGHLHRNNHIISEYYADAVLAAETFDSAVVGHNHCAKVFWIGGSQSLANGGIFPFNSEARYIFSPGAVAYSRDGNSSPSCAVLDLEKKTFEVIRPKAN